jgi:hypothetical protein
MCAVEIGVFGARCEWWLRDKKARRRLLVSIRHISRDGPAVRRWAEVRQIPETYPRSSCSLPVMKAEDRASDETFQLGTWNALFWYSIEKMCYVTMRLLMIVKAKLFETDLSPSMLVNSVYEL